MAFDVRTAFLVATAIGTPLLLQSASNAGVAIPVYITAGQRAALAAFPSTIAGYSTVPAGSSQADVSTLYARWSAINEAIKAVAGSSTGGKTYPGHPEWTPANFAKLDPSQATALANAVIAAADAGASSATESYDGSTGTANSGTTGAIADSQAYQDLKGLLATDSTWGSDAGDAEDFAPAILALVLECDQRGYLAAGKPIEPTISGGLGAAADAVGSFVTGIAGKAIGGAAGLAADALLSTPALVLIAGLIVYKAAKHT